MDEPYQNASERSRENACYERYCFASGHLQHERYRPGMERKYMNSDKAQRKEPESTTARSGAVGGGTNIQSMQAPVLRYKSLSKTRAKPEELVCRSRHVPVKTPRTQLEKQAKITQH